MCVNGACRTSCATNSDCCLCGDAIICPGGFCVTPGEAAPMCRWRTTAGACSPASTPSVSRSPPSMSSARHSRAALASNHPGMAGLISRPCSRPRSGRRTASSTSSRTRRTTCWTRSASSAASTPRTGRSRRQGRGGGRSRAVHLEDRAQRTARSSASSRAPRSRRSRTSTRRRSQPAADPGHGAAVHGREAALRSARGFDNVGDLEEPRAKYLIIDGQHRLAALHFFRKERAADDAHDCTCRA